MAEAKDQEPQQERSITKEEPRKRPRALDQASPVLSEDELRQSGVRKMMQDELERLREENAELISYRGLYYDSVKECAILQQRVKVSIAGDILSLGCTAIGGALIGLSSRIGTSDLFYTKVLVVIGFLLLSIAVVAKWKMR